MDFEVFGFYHIPLYDAKLQSVTEDLVRYMSVGHQHGEFLTQDPQWAIDFAPNGKLENNIIPGLL
jgi:hypothetical protein